MKLTEEEKKAVENLDELLGLTVNAYNDETDESVKKLYGKYVDVYETVLNLIEKQQEEIEKLKVEKNIAKMKNGALKRLYDNSVSKVKIEELINHYKNEIESENDLLEQRIITRKDYERRRSLHNNYIHILNKLLE